MDHDYWTSPSPFRSERAGVRVAGIFRPIQNRNALGEVDALRRRASFAEPERREPPARAMPLFEQLSQEAAKRGLKSLVIGGHAVIAHGYARTTFDVDLFVEKV
jgi:hypothetical protein